MKLEEFKSLAKTMTREEFLKEFKNTIYFYSHNGITCPSDIGLNEREGRCYYHDEEDNNCNECWEDAIRFIEFKDDKEK